MRYSDLRVGMIFDTPAEQGYVITEVDGDGYNFGAALPSDGVVCSFTLHPEFTINFRNS